MTFLNRSLLCVLLTTSLSACSIFNTFGTDNIPKPAPLPVVSSDFKSTVVWSDSVGQGSDGAYLRLQPALVNAVVLSVDADGLLTATDIKGHKVYSHKLAQGGRSGIGSNGLLMAVVDSHAQLSVLDVSNGKLLWQASVTNIVLAPPLVTATTTYVKTIDGTVAAYNNSNGQLLWSYSHSGPTLVLRTSSPLVAVGNTLYSGFSDGQVVALDANNGNELWVQTVANPNGAAEIERMVDIDSKIVVNDGTLFAASYQGQVAALRLSDGQILWQQPISTYVDLAYINHLVIVPEANGTIKAFNSNTGAIVWQQNNLAWRFLSGIALLNDCLVVGDLQGYLHVMTATTGQYLGHAQPTQAAIYSTPLVVGKDVYSVDSHGKLSAVHVD